MAATATLLTAGTATGNPGTTASVSPTSGRLLEVDVIATTDGDAITSGDMTPSGLSATWVQVAFVAYGSRRGIWRFRAESDGTSGTISLTYGGAGTFAEMGWSIKEWDGQIGGNNGADAVGTPVSSDTFDTVLSLTITDTPSTGDAVSAVFGIEASGGGGSFEVGYTTLTDQVGTDDNIRQMLVGWEDSANDTTPSVSWGSSSAAGGIANLIIAGTASLDITPAPVTVTASAGSLTITTGAVDITPAATTVTATPGTVSLAVDLAPAGPTVTATPGSLTITTTASITPAATTVTATPGTLTVSVGGATQAITPAAVTVTASAGSLSLAVDVVPAPVTVTATAGTVALGLDIPLTGASATASPGTAALAIDAPLAGAAVGVTPGTLAIGQGTPLFPDAVTVTATAGGLTITTGAVDITPAAVTVAVTAGALTIGGGIAAASSTATVAAAVASTSTVAAAGTSVATVTAAGTSTSAVSEG